MVGIPEELRPGGIVSGPVLRGSGYSAADVRKARRHGRLERVRQGWYQFDDPNPMVLRAVRAGAVLSCLSALSFHGVWVPPTPELHVSFSRFGRSGQRYRAGVQICSPPGRRGAPVLAVDPPDVALAAAARCAGPEVVLVLMESIIHLGLMKRSDLLPALSGCPPKIMCLINRCQASESGTETMVRDRLERRGVRVRSQVKIGDVGRVDLLVGRRLVIEVDSVAHHTSLENYHKDRLRDLRLLTLDYRVVRLTYEQVMSGWDEVEQYLLAIVRRGDHRRAPRSRKLPALAGSAASRR